MVNMLIYVKRHKTNASIEISGTGLTLTHLNIIPLVMLNDLLSYLSIIYCIFIYLLNKYLLNKYLLANNKINNNDNHILGCLHSINYIFHHFF